VRGLWYHYLISVLLDTTSSALKRRLFDHWVRHFRQHLVPGTPWWGSTSFCARDKHLKVPRKMRCGTYTQQQSRRIFIAFTPLKKLRIAAGNCSQRWDSICIESNISFLSLVVRRITATSQMLMSDSTRVRWSISVQLDSLFSIATV